MWAGWDCDVSIAISPSYAREQTEKHAIMMRHERLRVAPTSKNIDDPNILMKINTVVASW